MAHSFPHVQIVKTFQSTFQPRGFADTVKIFAQLAFARSRKGNNSFKRARCILHRVVPSTNFCTDRKVWQEQVFENAVEANPPTLEAT